MSRIVSKRIVKCEVKDSKYFGKYYPVFYYEDKSISPKRMFALAEDKQRKAEMAADLHMEKHNKRYDEAQSVDTGIAREGMEDVTIAELLDEYLDSLKLNNLKEATIIEKRGVINNVIKPFYGSKLLCELSPELIADYKIYCMSQKNRKMTNDLDAPKLSDRRIQKFWEINKTFINWMKNDKKYIKVDPVGEIKRPTVRDKSVAKYWKKEEFAEFYKAIPEDSQDRALFLLAFLTGMREGEILGLTWDDVNFENDEVKIEKQYNTKIHKVDTLKTNSSIRKTKFPEVVKIELMKLKERIKNHHNINEQRLTNMPIFTNGKLEHLSAKTVHNHMTKYILESNVKKIKFHELRNSFITNAIDNRIHPDVVSKLVGHAKVTTTMDVYKCTTDVHAEEARVALDDFSADLLEL